MIMNDLTIYKLNEEILLNRAEQRDEIHAADSIQLGHKALSMMMMMMIKRAPDDQI